MIAPGARLRGEESYVPIPGSGMHIHPHCEYVDRESPARPASEWLMERIRQNGSRSGGTQLLAFNPLPNVTRCVLLRFEQKSNRRFCDFYESSGVARIREPLAYRSSEAVVLLAIRGGAIMDYENASVFIGESKSDTATQVPFRIPREPLHARVEARSRNSVRWKAPL